MVKKNYNRIKINPKFINSPKVSSILLKETEDIKRWLYE